MRDLTKRACGLGEVVDITECGAFDGETLARARCCRDARRAVLRRYRWDHVRPVLRERDLRAFDAAAAVTIPVLGVPFSSLVPVPAPLPLALLGWKYDSLSWRWFRCWALIRISGRWPGVLVGADDMPFVMDRCPRCGSEFVNE